MEHRLAAKVRVVAFAALQPLALAFLWLHHAGCRIAQGLTGLRVLRRAAHQRECMSDCRLSHRVRSKSQHRSFAAVCVPAVFVQTHVHESSLRASALAVPPSRSGSLRAAWRLTIPSSGQSTGCARRLPLMSNVRRLYVITYGRRSVSSRKDRGG